MIDKVELESFLNKVRSCDDDRCKVLPCKVGERCTPFVYGKTTSKILVVSEAPPPGAWSKNKGKDWEHKITVTQDGKDIVSKFVRWVDILSIAEKRLFWIQRANCSVPNDHNLDLVYLRCGRKFLSEAVELVKPEFIITLGGRAADYFYPKFATIKNLMERRIYSGLKPKRHQSYEMFPFYHPSERAEIERQKNIDLHNKMVELVKEKIRTSGLLENHP